jgi:hypothetical protein
MDTLVGLCYLPTSLLYRTKCYIGSFLMTAPVIGTLSKCCGHFPVYFSGKGYGSFSVDRTKMEETERRVDAHLNLGNHVVFFPEGQVNKHPDVLEPFRFGGFKKALEFDANLWAFTTHNLEVAWPRTAPVGGWPAHCRTDFRPVAREGCRALVAELRRAQPQQTEGKEDYEVLSLHCREVLQGVKSGFLLDDAEDTDTKKVR